MQWMANEGRLRITRSLKTIGLSHALTTCEENQVFCLLVVRSFTLGTGVLIGLKVNEIHLIGNRKAKLLNMRSDHIQRNRLKCEG